MHRNMSIRHKTILLISVLLVIFIGFLAAISYQFVTHRFEKLEQDNVESHLATVHSQIQVNIDTLDAISGDWGQWDETYEFIMGKNSEYIKDNLYDDALENLHLNFMLFYDTNEDLVCQKYISLYPDVPEINKRSLINAIQTAPHILSIKESNTSTSGILIAESSAYLIAAHPITNSFADRPAKGTLVVGRRLDSFEIEQIGASAQTKLTVRIANSNASTEDSQGQPNGSSSADVIIERLDPDTILGRSQIFDLTEKQKLLIEIKLDRDVFRQGFITWRNNTLSMIALGAVFIALLLITLDRWILNRLANLAKDIGNLSFAEGKPDRLEIKSQDELGSMASSINSMLAELNKYHADLVTANQQLENEIGVRKEAEAKKEVLISELQKILNEVKTLRGFLPICSSCKKIRDDQGYWNQIEAYIRKHSDAEFSHGLCPDCIKKLYPDIDFSDEAT